MNGEAKKDAIKGRLQELVQDGTLTAENVVDDARSPESPLHQHFEWNDTAAAEKYRITQARKLISSVHVTIIEELRLIDTVAYIRDPDLGPRDQGYAAVTEIRTDAERARKAILNEIATASAYLARVRALSTALGLDGAVESVEREMALLKEKVGVA